MSPYRTPAVQNVRREYKHSWWMRLKRLWLRFCMAWITQEMWPFPNGYTAQRRFDRWYSRMLRGIHSREPVNPNDYIKEHPGFLDIDRGHHDR